MNFCVVQVNPGEPSMKWKDITDRAATTVFATEVIRGNFVVVVVIVILVNISLLIYTRRGHSFSNKLSYMYNLDFWIVTTTWWKLCFCYCIIPKCQFKSLFIHHGEVTQISKTTKSLAVRKYDVDKPLHFEPHKFLFLFLNKICWIFWYLYCWFSISFPKLLNSFSSFSRCWKFNF